MTEGPGESAGLFARARGLVGGATPAVATAQTAAASILILALNLCTGVLTARLLGPQGRGELAAVTTWPQFMAFLLTLGLPAASLYNLKRYPELARSLFWSLMILATLAGGVATVLGVLLLPAWLTEYSPTIVVAGQWAMLLAPISLANLSLTCVLQAREEFKLFNLSRLAPPICTLLFLIVAAATGPLTSLKAAVATLAALIPIFVYQLLRLSRVYPFTLAGLPLANRLMLSYGFRSYGISLVGALGGQLDRAILVGMVSPSMMGTYVVAANASLAVAAIPTALGMVLLPRAAGRSAEDVVEMTGRAGRASMIGSVPAALVLMAAGPFVIGMLYGSGFDEAVPVFRILLVEAVLRGLVVILAQAFMALDRPGLATVVDGVGLGTLLAALVLLVPAWGLVGAGLSLVASALARLVLLLVFFRSTLRVRLPRLVPGLDDFRVLAGRVLGRSGD